VTLVPPIDVDVDDVRRQLADRGYAVIRRLVDHATSDEIVAKFDDDHRYRSTIDMKRHGFGVGTYRYYGYPLPTEVDDLRCSLYAVLAPLANEWEEQLSSPARYPPSLDEFLRVCHHAGQRRTTPLVLRYGPGHYNCLHQDRYGAVAFPLQVAVLLTPAPSFVGGEFVLVEQRPRMQSRAHVVRLDLGDAVIFPNQVRPNRGAKGVYRTQFRHGVATLESGRRHVLGLIFHDAE
jgi:uncharacterized protein